MDKLKTRVLFISLIILALVSISAVAAADSVNDDIISANQEDFDLSEETNDVEQLGANAIDDTDSKGPLTAGESGSFSELQDLIDTAHEGDTIELEDNYLKVSGENPIIINKTITIDGKGHTIDANYLDAILATNSPVTLKNIVFKNANVTATTDLRVNGIYYRIASAVNLGTGSVGTIVDNCTFRDNTARLGGAIYWNGKDGILNNSVFENNKVNTSVKNDGVYGGAIYWAGENGIIENTNFTENAAYSYVNESDPKNSTGSRGGAIYFTNANNILIIDSNFIRNFVPRYGNTVGGGAIYFSNSKNGRIVNSNFTENHAGASGGAIYIDKNSKGHNITDSSFSKNVADGHDSNQQSGVSGYGGGAIYWMGSDGSIVNTNFTDNMGNTGGAIYYTTDANNQKISDLSFINNSAKTTPSSVSSLTPHGGAIYWMSENGTVKNVNFTDNFANMSGGAIYYKNAKNQSISDSSFTNNTANGTGSYGGGAIFYDSVNNATINNVNFTDNSGYRGGAIHNFKGTGTQSIADSSFSNNNASSGGAIYIDTTNNAVIKDSNLTENSANASGGAIYWKGTDGIVDNVNFTDNFANSSGGAIYFTGAHKQLISGSTFSNNSANGTQTSGAGAIYFASSNNGTIKNSIFNENSAINGSGGAIIYSSSNNQKISDSSFSNNSANSSKNNAGGGAIYYSSSKNGTIENVNFTENSATAGGGAICYYGTGNTNQTIKDSNFLNNSVNGSSYSHGGAIYWGSPNGTIENVNFTENFASKNGGAIYYYGSSNKYQLITDSSFTKNTANGSSSSYGGGAIFYDRGVSNSSIEKSNFTENSALSGVGGAIYYNSAHNDSIIDVNFTGNTAKSAGGAIYYKSANNQTIRDSSFTNNSVNATQTTTSYGGGAIYYSTAHNGSIENVNFTENHASNGGAIVYSGSHNQSIDVANFLNNNATNGGAIAYYTTSNNGSIENANFTGNVAKTNGGAIYYSSSDNQTIADSIFNGNNATSGSAIYHSVGSLNISSTELLENQAHAASLNGSAEVEGFDATIHTVFKGKDNLLNAIYTNAYTDVRLTDVDYWGAEDKMNTGASEVTPVASADESEEGTLVYKDDREAGINITVSIYDNETGGFIKNVTGKTDIYGDIKLSDLGLVPGIYKAVAIHKEDKYYTEILSKEFEFEIPKANSTVNGTNVTKVYGETIEVTIASENATAVIYNITDDKTGQVVVENTPVAANGTVTMPTLDVGEYTVNYVTVVDGNHYAVTNTSKITVTPAPSCVNGTDVTEVYGNPVVVTVASENATKVIYNITGADGTVVVDTEIPANGTFTVPVTLDVGEYTVNFVTVVDGNHYAVTNTSKITVTPASSSVSAEDVAKVYNESIEVAVTSVNATSVTYKITGNGIDPITGTIAPGESINVPVPLDVGEYTVTLTTNVDKNHESVTDTSKITVTPASSSVSAEDVTKVYGESIEVVVTSVNATSVTYEITGEGISPITGTVSEDGTITVPTLEVGEYTVTLTTVTDKNHESVTNTSKITIQKIDVIVTVDKVINYTGAVVDVIANVTGVDGKNITGGIATFIIHYDNKLGSGLLMAAVEEYTAEVIDGKAEFKGITLGAPGTYPSTIQYSGNEHYNAAENKSEVIVLPLNTTTESDDVSGSSGDKVDIVADIVDQNGKPVQNGTAVLKLNGKEYKAEVKEGKATFKGVELPSESTEATIDYLGNDYYNPSKTTIQITINEEPEPEPQPEPVNPVTEKSVPVIPAAGNPIALVVIALLTLVSTVSLGRKK